MKHHREVEVNEGGTFTVTGTNTAVIKLAGKKIHHLHVDVDFDAACPPLVCNPHHHDRLEWEVIEAASHHQHLSELHIKWHVSGMRMIKWSVEYAK